MLDIGGESLAKVFKSEISFGLLGEIIGILDEHVVEGDSGKVVDVLMGLSQAGRFGLSLDFLSKGEKEKLTDLVVKLEGWTKYNKTDPISTDTDDRSVSLNEDGEDRGQENAIQGALSEEKHLENEQDCCGETIYGRQVDVEVLKKLYKLEDN